MSSLERITTNIVSDYKALQNSSDTDEKTIQMRKTSLLLRIYGIALACFACCIFVGALCTLPVSPIPSVLVLGSSIFLFAVAHDLVVIGDNQSNVINSISEASKRGILNIFTTIGGAVWNEAVEKIPYSLANTWLAASIYRECNQ